MAGLGWPELTVIALLVVALFGWKKLPDMARSLGRSARVFKSEVNEMKNDGKEPSDAARYTVPGDVVDDSPAQTARSGDEAARKAADARVAEAEAQAAQARAEAAKLRGDSTV